MKKKPPLPPLPPPRDGGGEQSMWGEIKKLRYSGTVKKQSHIAYSFLLFSLKENEETESLLKETAKAYLAFLEKAAERKRDGVFFAGLDCTGTEDGILLSAVFCPFSEPRVLRPVAQILWDENKQIQGVKTGKRLF